MDLTKEELSIVVHAIGGRDLSRNYFVADIGSADESACLSLVAKGAMVNFGSLPWCVDSILFSVTELGKNAAMLALPPPRKMTPSQKRYEAFLRCDPGVPFGEWLRKRMYKYA